MRAKGFVKKIIGLALLTVFPYSAHASGYKVEFQSASVLADAGEAAVVEDAGTNWYNSAGLVYLPLQVVFSTIDVYAPASFSGRVTAPSTLPPQFAAFGRNFATGGTSSSHPNSVLPALHYSIPINDRFTFGLSAVPAWGFAEEYIENSILRYNLTRVYTKTIQIAPSLAMKVNDHWSFGLGPDFHYFSVESRSHVRTEGAFPFGTPFDSISRFSGDRWGYGAHAGVLYRFDDATRIGLNYRSKIVMNLNGYSNFSFSGGRSFQSKSFRLGVPLPPSTTLSIYHDMTPCWAVMGTLAYDQWSVLKQYRAKGYIQPISPTAATVIPVTLQQNMSNTIDVSAGTHFKLTDKLMLRGSVKYEPTPTISQFREVSFPDGPKLGFQIGSRYQMSKKIALDFIYGHVFVKTVRINDVNPVTGAVANGQSRNAVDLLGGQIVWSI